VSPPPSTRLLLTIPFAIPAYWTPEQALAVVELLEDLRDLIWSHYGAQLREQCREQSGCPLRFDTPADDPDDLSF
jgi:hypothetical protein